jgi:hypothetical protein
MIFIRPGLRNAGSTMSLANRFMSATDVIPPPYDMPFDASAW